MKLTAPQIEHVANQLQARPVPEDSRMAPDLERHFGEHTFFLGRDGLHILELEDAEEPSETGIVLRVARWTDADRTALAPQEPEPTGTVVQLDEAA